MCYASDISTMPLLGIFEIILLLNYILRNLLIM